MLKSRCEDAQKRILHLLFDILHYIFMQRCTCCARPGKHFPEHALNLLPDACLVKINEKQTLIGEDGTQLVGEGGRFSHHNIF